MRADAPLRVADENAGYDAKIYYTSGGESMSIAYRGSWEVGSTETLALV